MDIQAGECVFCRRTRVGPDLVLVRIDYANRKVSYAVSPGLYAGIRVICRDCVEGIRGLAAGEGSH